MQFNKISELLSEKPAAIIWLSGIEGETDFPEIRQKWGIKSDVLYKESTSTGNIYRESLEELGLITTKVARRGKFKVQSNLDWVPSFFKQLLDKHKNSPVVPHYVTIIEKIMPKEVGAMIRILNSNAFKKGCMKLDFLVGEIKKARFKSAFWKEIENKNYAPPIPEEAKMISFVGDSSGPIFDRPFKVPTKEERIALVKRVKKAEEEPWKFSFRWLDVLLSKCQCLALARAFEEDSRCLEYWKSGHVHVEPPVEIFARGSNVVENTHKKIKEKGYEIPKEIEPYFTFDDLVDRQIKFLDRIKEDWPEIWSEVKERFLRKELKET
ncbi:hypothetical protein AKJ45_03425 [candidate division MSBL1 archaeon SCGC-AAA261F19]|uniref:Uncharacterized protein n=1 Tax=candidate division MSBL1 archaeon SCGC-AAA261F19 TaxID=1698275 RepID=A0A133V867_9EURY|nr:hypothetical protein AKJ45_03425 [candidate division MSBL1 archaeon SCGC-AAA261F19]